MRIRHLCVFAVCLVLVLSSGCCCRRWCHRRDIGPGDGCCESCGAHVVADCGCAGGGSTLPPPMIVPFQPPPLAK
jgi:hypothetical protein